MSGDGGCNGFGGGVRVDDSQIKFSQLISTKRACVDAEIQKTEDDFVKALDEVSGFKIEGDVLRLTSGDETVLILRR